MATHTKKLGFTLIELLVVIMIIGLLTGLATTSYINAQKTARDNVRKSNVASISTAVQAFYQAKRRFPGLVGNEPAIPLLADRANWAGCLALDKGGGTYSSVLYYSFPAVTPCNSSTRNDANGFKHDQYLPYPNWIPELGEYLNPVPQETRYQNSSGSTSGTLDASDGSFTADGADVLGSNNGNNIALAYVYRHLVGGYMVYARLEGSTTDIQVGTFTNSPKYGTTGGGTVGVQVFSNKVFMIRQ
jgi:prepilin-type N-terminal cleavage/methylation domain-containing protein